MPLESTQPMDPPAALLQPLRDLRRQTEAVDVESTRARASWLEAVGALLEVLRGWLPPAVSEGLARLDRASFHVADDDGAPYDAPALKIVFSAARLVWVRPVGTLRVGGQGIADLVCASNRALRVSTAQGSGRSAAPQRAVRSLRPTFTRSPGPSASCFCEALSPWLHRPLCRCPTIR